MTPRGSPAMSPPRTRAGPTRIGVAIIALMIVAIVALVVFDALRERSPEAVRSQLRGAKKGYVGSWSSSDRVLSASLDIGATGDISYDESSRLRATRGEAGDLEADDLHISAFEGDDIVVGGFTPPLRIRVTSRPHEVGDHVEMTSNGVRFVRDAAR
ncbi:MAG: hypothetical protein ACRELB_23830 [Polyangiaceae bacterium]